MSYNKVQISKNPGLHKEISYIHYYNSPLGRITLASNGNALTGLWFDGQKYFGSTLTKEYIPKDLPVFGQASHWLDIYFSGKAPGFTPLLSLNTTPFRESVWEIMLKIPFGQTMSYKEIACIVAGQRGLSHMSAHAVGGAVAHNPVSLIIPCHRVIGANRNLTGYAGGIDKKIKLLNMENVDTKTLFIPKNGTAL